MHGQPTGDAQLLRARAMSDHRDDHRDDRMLVGYDDHDGATSALDLAALVMDMAVASADEEHAEANDDGVDRGLLLQQPRSALSGDASFVVALFCDGFVCRHWTRKSGWVEGFAQSYDATSRYFLDCLEKERLPDGLLELMDPTTPSNELRTEIWDLRTHPTALCPLTSADLPRTAPLPSEISGVTVRQVVLQPRDHVVLTELVSTKQPDCHPASEQFPQLSNADLEALTYDELASLALGPDSELLQVDESLALLSVDEVVGPTCGDDDQMNEEHVMSSTVDAIDQLLESSPRPTIDGNPFVSWPDSPSSDDDWIVKNDALRSIAPIDGDLTFVKSELSSPLPDQRRPAKQAKKKKDTNPNSPRSDDSGISLASLPQSSFHLSLSQDACNWLDSVESKRTSKKRKKKYRCLKPTIDGATPLPATHLFLSRLKGKRPRNYTIDELDHRSPAWMMMKHMTRFYQAALTFERRHAHFLQVNVERIMTAESREAEPRKLAAGSMNYVAMQLRHFTRPDQVIAAAEEARQLASPLAAEMARWRPSAALVNPEAEEDSKVSCMRSPTAAFRAGSAQFLEESKRSPTSNLAAMTITSPTADSRMSKKKKPTLGLLVSPTQNQCNKSPLSAQSPPPRSSGPFMDGLDGETFEF